MDRDLCNFNPMTGEEEPMNEDCRKSAEALDMAIKALERQPCEDTISRQDAIDTEGLDEEIRCEMCRNPMHTSRGCDGNCTYDEKLYEKIMQILDRRIKQLPSAQPDIIRCKDCKFYTAMNRKTKSGICSLIMHQNFGDDWYCAGAERRADG